MVGIYGIINITNNKIYVGQSIDIENRWKQHKKELNGGYHCNSYLQNAWNKYGPDNFKFVILKECTIEQLNDFECSFIEQYNSCDQDHGYNMQLGGQGVHKYGPAEYEAHRDGWNKVKEKFIKAGRGNRKRKTKCLEDGKIFDSARKAAEYYGFNENKITEVCRGKGPHYSIHGLHFEYIV